MRVEMSCLYLREILPQALYMEVRTAVSRWNIAADERQERKTA